jgi:hypothetical protein
MAEATASKRIYLSYAHSDGADLAQRLLHDLTSTGFDVWLDTKRLAGGASWTVEIESAIDRSDVLIALMTHGSYVSDVCRAEQLRALRRGCLVLPVVAQANSEIPIYLETKQHRSFADGYQLSELLDDIHLKRNGVDLCSRFRTTYVTAPPLPRNYVHRGQIAERAAYGSLWRNGGVNGT